MHCHVTRSQPDVCSSKPLSTSLAGEKEHVVDGRNVGVAVQSCYTGPIWNTFLPGLVCSISCEGRCSPKLSARLVETALERPVRENPEPNSRTLHWVWTKCIYLISASPISMKIPQVLIIVMLGEVGDGQAERPWRQSQGRDEALGTALIRPTAEISRGGTLPVLCRCRLGAINDLCDLSFWDWAAIDRWQRALRGAI